VSWLNVYVQVAYVNDTGEVLMPQYPQQVFVQIAEVCGPSACPLCVCVAHHSSGASRSFMWHLVLVLLSSLASRPVRPGCWLLRISLWCPRCFCFVSFLLTGVDAEGLRYVGLSCEFTDKVSSRYKPAISCGLSL
jgi:hypothetical protein